MLLARSAAKFPRLKHFWADQGYRGQDFLARVHEETGITIQITQPNRSPLRRDGYRRRVDVAGCRERSVLSDKLLLAVRGSRRAHVTYISSEVIPTSSSSG
ncbi:hypothetical protein [Streptomyces smyrnaeus]|uniref:hypothetical protein n=1 Tax=Streptomyces smyrnaeus TaxID=1387713 RepID=UPI003401A774